MKTGDRITSENKWSLNKGDLLKIRAGHEGAGRVIEVESVSDGGIKERGDDHEAYYPMCYEFFAPANVVSERDLRDEFAMAALTGLLAREDNQYAARDAYAYADAMMEMRKNDAASKATGAPQ